MWGPHGSGETLGAEFLVDVPTVVVVLVAEMGWSGVGTHTVEHLALAPEGVGEPPPGSVLTTYLVSLRRPQPPLYPHQCCCGDSAQSDWSRPSHWGS